MGDYRVRRIQELISSKDKLDLQDMQRIQSDLLSVQARSYMKILKYVQCIY